MKYTSLLVSLLCFCASLYAEQQYDDGPYLSYKNNQVKALNIVQGVPQNTIYSGSLLIPKQFEIAKKDHYHGIENIAAISDIHGQITVFKTLLINNGIINNALDWQFGKGHLVITGDIFDRGDTVIEALWLVYKLEQQAKRAGGQVHYLLGNHEYMVLRGDQRYLHPKYLASLTHFDNDLKKMFSKQTVLGRWLRSKSTIININGFVFLHGGIHQDFLALNKSLEQANILFRETIGLSKAELSKNPVYTSLHGRTGPIWYRGYFRNPLINQTDVEAVLTGLNAKHIIVGHTSMPELETRFNNKVIAIDSSIKKGKNGELLLWNNEQFMRGKMNGEQQRLW